MTVVEWPRELAPRAVSFNLRGEVSRGGVSLTNRTQVAVIDAGYWVAEYSAVPVETPERVKLYRRVRAKMRGGGGLVAVPVFDQENAPWPVEGIWSAPSTGFTDGTQFSDGFGFFEPAIQVTASADAAIRATTITAEVAAAGEIVGGEYFSVRDRLYQIEEVLDVAVTSSEQTWLIKPGLRAAIADGDDLNFDRPTCLMQLAEPGADDLDLEVGRYGFPDLSFVEVITE